MRTMQVNWVKQQGVVSLMVTLVMMIVITLLILGFAEIARNEQRSSLDDQLSTQAYYAAESGINDARAVISQAIASGGPDSVSSNNSCSPQGAYSGLTTTVDTTHNVAYTCLLINATPTTIVQDIGSSSAVIPITSGSGGPAFSTLTLSWTAASGLPSSPTGCYTDILNLSNKPVVGSWSCNYPMVRVDLVNAAGVLTRNGWSGRTSTMFFVPYDSTAVNNTIGFGAHGAAVPARCSAASRLCTAVINGLGTNTYYLRATTLYKSNSRLTLTAGGIPFVGVQATIDATGRAQDVLRRVKIAVDLTDANAHKIPSAAVVSRDSVCKRFGVTPGSPLGFFQVYEDMSAGAPGNNFCQLQTIGSPAAQ